MVYPALKFLENMHDVNYNTATISNYKQLLPQFLCSFPRSGNGWIRSLITACHLHDLGFPASGLTSSYVEKDGVRYSALKFEDQLFEVDGFLPDIYAVDKHLSSILDYKERYDFNVKLVKTHHVLKNANSRHVLLIREPVMCIPSTLKLLHSSVEIKEMEAGLQYVAQQYVSYMNYFSQCSMPVWVLDHEKLCEAPEKTLRSLFDYLEIKISDEAICESASNFPFKSNAKPKYEILADAPNAARFIKTVALDAYRNVQLLSSTN